MEAIAFVGWRPSPIASRFDVHDLNGPNQRLGFPDVQQVCAGHYDVELQRPHSRGCCGALSPVTVAQVVAIVLFLTIV